jgi:hypothetical protein
MLCSWEIQLFLDRAARGAARTPSTAGELFQCPPAVPSEEHLALLDECIALARAVGLRLSTRLRIMWVYGREDLAHGAVRQSEDGQLRMALSIYTGRWDLAKAIYHELRHCHDFATGRAFNRAEWEVDASRFARAMMARLMSL